MTLQRSSALRVVLLAGTQEKDKSLSGCSSKIDRCRALPVSERSRKWTRAESEIEDVWRSVCTKIVARASRETSRASWISRASSDGLHIFSEIHTYYRHILSLVHDEPCSELDMFSR